MMKMLKYVLAATLCLTLVLSSCSKLPEEVAGVQVSLSTKLSFDDSTSVVWNEGDDFSVFYHSDSPSRWVCSGSGTSAAISGKSSSGSAEGIYVIYPYVINVNKKTSSSENAVFEIGIPSVQVPVTDSFTDQCAIMAGKEDGGTVCMHFATAFIALDFSGLDMMVNSVTLNASSPLSGSGTLTFNGESCHLSPGQTAVTSLVLKSSDGRPFPVRAAGTRFLVPVFSGSYPEGFQALVKFADGSETVFRDSFDRNLEAGHIHPFACRLTGSLMSFDMSLPFQTDGRGSSPFLEIKTIDGAQTVTARRFTPIEYPDYKIDFTMEKIRLIRGNNNGLELTVSSSGSIVVPAVKGMKLHRVCVLGDSGQSCKIHLADKSGELISTKSEFIQGLTYIAITPSTIENTPYVIVFTGDGCIGRLSGLNFSYICE